jgi:hypothetical protein
MIEYYTLGLSLLLVLSLIFKLRKVSKENFETKKSLVEVYRSGMMETDQAKEDFIKFISDSREWAFDYIEDAQKQLSEFVDKVDSDIEHFNKYGDEMSMKPNYNALKNISEAYAELKKLLPNDERENR